MKLPSWEGQYLDGYTNYKVDSATCKRFEIELRRAKEIKVFLGTWCSDSQEQVPRIMKILEQNINSQKVELVGVNKDKNRPLIAKEFGLSKVPSVFLITASNDTLKLFEEVPSNNTIEMDMLKSYSEYTRKEAIKALGEIKYEKPIKSRNE